MRPKTSASSGEAHALSAFDKTVQKTYAWLDELAEDLSWTDRKQTYTALRATLHVLRDRLPVNEAADLASQLPMLLRGIFYEGWKPAATPIKIRHLDEFLEPIDAVLVFERATPAEEVAGAVLRLLSKHVTSGEMDDVAGLLPKELRSFYSESVHAAA